MPVQSILAGAFAGLLYMSEYILWVCPPFDAARMPQEGVQTRGDGVQLLQDIYVDAHPSAGGSAGVHRDPEPKLGRILPSVMGVFSAVRTCILLRRLRTVGILDDGNVKVL